jgi:hypothetical protein
MSRDFIDPEEDHGLRQDTVDYTNALSNKKSIIHEGMQKLKTAYARVFDDPHNLAAISTVLDDLSWYCYAERSTYHSDARDHALAEGRREVMLRINDVRHKSTEELAEMAQAALKT